MLPRGRQAAAPPGHAGKPPPQADRASKGRLVTTWRSARRRRLNDAAHKSTTLRSPSPHKVRLEELQARVGALRLLASPAAPALDLQGGTVRRPARRQDVGERLDRAGEQGFRKSPPAPGASTWWAFSLISSRPPKRASARAALDLDLKSTVKQNQLHAPSSPPPSPTSNWPPARAVQPPSWACRGPRSSGMLKDKSGRITVKFVLEGRLDDPRFSSTKPLATRIGTSMAEALGQPGIGGQGGEQHHPGHRQAAWASFSASRRAGPVPRTAMPQSGGLPPIRLS